MRFVGVIPVRYGAVRFPGKALHMIEGKPLVQWVLDGVRTSRMVKEFVIATDDERIAAVAKKCGVQAVMTDSALPSGSDRIYQALQRRIGPAVDVVINVQGDEPLVTGEVVDQLAQVFVDSPTIEMATLGHEINDAELANPQTVKVIVNKEHDAIYFSRFGIPHSRHDAKTAGGMGCLKHIGLYAYQRKFLEKFCSEPPPLIEISESLEQLRALYLGARIRVVKTDAILQGVDTPEDVDKVLALLKNRRA